MIRPRRHWPCHHARLPMSLLAGMAALALLPTVGRAQDSLSTRSLGMGQALRGAATGSAALGLNPSGMSLLKTYVIEGAYRFAQKAEGHSAHVAIADSTSAFNIAGGLYYTYASVKPNESTEQSRHEAGVALSFPVGDRFFIGGNVRYLRARSEVGLTPVTTTTTTTTGLTFDAGITVRPVDMLSLGIVGYGLRDLEDPQAPFAVGGGVALLPISALTVAVDGLVDFRSYLPDTADAGNAITVSGGVEYTMVSRVAVRLGGGRDGQREQGFATAGLSALSTIGAVDVGARLDVSGANRGFYFGVSGRLFVPTP